MTKSLLAKFMGSWLRGQHGHLVGYKVRVHDLKGSPSETTLWSLWFYMVNFQHIKGLFTPNKSENDSEKDQRTSKADQRISYKHHRKCSLLRSLSLSLNTA